MDENEQKPEKVHFSLKRLAMTTLIVVVTAGVVFGITWFILDKMTNENEEASDKLRIELQKQIDELRVKLKKDVSSAAATDPLVYVNDKYSFQVTFPTDWTGYKLLEKNIEGSMQTWYVELPTKDSAWAKASSTNDAGHVSLFAISAYTEQQWSDVNSNENNTNTFIKKIGSYTFAYSHAQAAASDITQSQSGEVKSIISTFKEI